MVYLRMVKVRLVRNMVGIALLSQEQLTMMGKALFFRLTADQGIKVGRLPIGFGSQHPTKSLGFFLAGTKGPGDLYQHFGIG
jgi:hypothetical protein